MAKVTWKGEDTAYQPGPSFTIWNGTKFPKDKAVEVADERMIAKARGNQYFSVADDKPKPAPPEPRPQPAPEPEELEPELEPEPEEKPKHRAPGKFKRKGHHASTRHEN